MILPLALHHEAFMASLEVRGLTQQFLYYKNKLRIGNAKQEQRLLMRFVLKCQEVFSLEGDHASSVKTGLEEVT